MEIPGVSVVSEGPTVTITGSGLLDLSNSGELAKELEIASATAERVAVDFREAVFIDTAVVQYLATAAVKMIERDERLHVLVKRDSHPERVIEILGFKELMDVESV